MVSVSESFFNCPATLYYPDSRQVAKFRWSGMCAASAGISTILMRRTHYRFPRELNFRNFLVTSNAVYVMHQRMNSARMADGNGIA
jgi:hypothetical protein